MYVRLTQGAVGILGTSRQFKRRGDNTSYHACYPINFRGEGGAPSIQFSVALDHLHALARRVADKPVDVMMADFLRAWLVEGDVKAAMSYVSRRASAKIALPNTAEDSA